MKKESVSTKDHLKSKKSPALSKGNGEVRSGRERTVSERRLEQIFADIRQKLTAGLSGAAEKILTNMLENYTHPADTTARFRRLLSYTLETQGRYKRAREVIEIYDDEELLNRLEPETQIAVITQLAIALNNTNDYPQAVALLNFALEQAEAEKLSALYGDIYVALARVYRKLNESQIARDNAEKGLNCHREQGDWHGMANAYHMIAGAYSHEGNNKKAVEYFQLAIKIIGDRSAPFLLGKIYSDMSGAYWFLRRPQDGIKCLEKSIGFFEQTEHKIQSIAAYNNLGINLMLLGEWDRAEKIIEQALDLAVEVNHSHIAGILDSLGELKLLRGELDEAQSLLERGVEVAEKHKREWYAIQVMRNLARCFLAQGKLTEARQKARETIELCKKVGESQIVNMARLVLAESFLQPGDFQACEAKLKEIEKTDPSKDFFVFGNIQRIRGLLALADGNKELAVHHFSRSLTIFEAAEDLYHTALANFLIGRTTAGEDPERAGKALVTAADIFRLLGVRPLFEESEKILEELKKAPPKKPDRNLKKDLSSAVSALLTLRLAEATASRELLFRELIAVLQQESRAEKVIIAELNEQKKYYPFITHGYIPAESMEVAARTQEALEKDRLEELAATKNLRGFELDAPSAPPALLIISPAAGAVLNDDSTIQPLLRVVELGMDVCALRDRDKEHQVEHETGAFTSNSLMPGFIHSSPAMTALVEEVYKIRSSDVTVLVTGESGTGKELVSRAIHTISNRKDRVFVPFNCTAVPKELAEGHLFGYKKGAFTGATSDSQGMIRAADGGTLFLDEIGDLPLDVQPKLLRFLQEGEVQPLGEKKPVKVDVRVIAATNMPLERMVEEGRFREDLYYRLNVIRLRVPPLRERRSEIPPIVNYYINQYSARFDKRDINITPQTMDLLMVCEWEGNVRQLCNEIQRIVARAADGETITPEHLSPELKRTAGPIASSLADKGNVRPIASFDKSYSSYNITSNSGTLEEAVTELEIRMIEDALERHNGNISRTARELGLTRRGLYLKLERYGIEKAA